MTWLRRDPWDELAHRDAKRDPLYSAPQVIVDEDELEALRREVVHLRRMVCTCTEGGSEPRLHEVSCRLRVFA